MSEIANFRLKGLVAATFTPFDGQNKLNLSIIPQYGKHLKDNGVNAIFVNGTTGEGLSLTIEERKQIVEEWMKNNKQGLEYVVVHVGGGNLDESIELAKHAVSVKADAVGLIAPTFFKPNSIGALVEYCRSVAEACPGLPFYYYHLPKLTGVQFKMSTFMEQAGAVIPNLRGIKFSDSDLHDLSECARLDNYKYNVIFGSDQMLLSAMVLGIDAAIGSTYNFMAPIYKCMIDKFEKGDIEGARKEQEKSMNVVSTMFKCGESVPILKEMMPVVGVDCGKTRCPLVNISDETRTILHQKLEDMKFKDMV